MMTWNFRFVSAACWLFLFAIAASLAQPAGLIIGLRHDQQFSPPLPYGETGAAARYSTYRTLWIFFDAPDSISIREINKLVLPRSDRFWQIEVIRHKQQDWVEDQLLCAPIDQRPAAPALDSLTVAECEGHKLLSLLFVGREFICYEGVSNGYCQGAAHPWHVNYLKTVTLDDPKSEGVGIATVVSHDAWQAMQQSAANYWARRRDERLDPNPDERSWGVIRRRGQWVLRGQLDYSAEVFRGTVAHFDVNFKLPHTMVGYNELLLPWKKLRTVVPATQDAISSPDKQWLLVLTRDQLMIYGMPHWIKLKESELRPGEFVIMVQWADATQVERWRGVITNLMAP